MSIIIIIVSRLAVSQSHVHHMTNHMMRHTHTDFGSKVLMLMSVGESPRLEICDIPVIVQDEVEDKVREKREVTEQKRR